MADVMVTVRRGITVEVVTVDDQAAEPAPDESETQEATGVKEVEEVANATPEANQGTDQDPNEAAPVADEGGSSNDDSAADGGAASTATDDPVAVADESSGDDGPTENELTPPNGEEAAADPENESGSTAAELGPKSSTDSGDDTAKAAPVDQEDAESTEATQVDDVTASADDEGDAAT